MGANPPPSPRAVPSSPSFYPERSKRWQLGFLVPASPDYSRSGPASLLPQNCPSGHCFLRSIPVLNGYQFAPWLVSSLCVSELRENSSRQESLSYDRSPVAPIS